MAGKLFRWVGRLCPALFLHVPLLAALLAAAPLHAASVLGVSPQGEVRDVRQVTVRFDADMVPLGQSDAAPPAVLRCEPATPTGQGRWIGPRVWAFELTKDLAAGARCTLVFKAGLQAMDGTALAKPADASFGVEPPRFSSLYPISHGEAAEGQVFVLAREGSAPASDKQAWVARFSCEWRSGEETGSMPAVIVSDARRIELEGQYAAVHPGSAMLALRCAQPLPSGSEMRLHYARDGEPEQFLDYRVRRPLTAVLGCRHVATTTDTVGCDPRQGIWLQLSNAVDAATASKVEMVGSDGLIRHFTGTGNLVLESSAPRFEEGATAILRLPDDVRDVDGRPLANAGEFPKTIEFARLPPYMGVATPYAVIPWHAAGVTPAAVFAVRNLEKTLALQQWHMDGASGPDAEAYALSLLQAQQNGELPQDSPTAHLGKPRPLTLGTTGGAMEFVSTPALTEPGLYVVRADSPIFAAYARAHPAVFGPADPHARFATVQVTNLNPSASLSDAGSSVIWVTAIDSARPVPDAEVSIYSCQQELLWRGRTNADGLADPGDALRGKLACATTRWRGRAAASWVTVRAGHDMVVMPVGVLWSGYPAVWGSQPFRAHTVLDRTLFAVGEKVNMEHVVRLLGTHGFEAPPATVLDVSIRYGPSDVVAKSATRLDTQGNGTSNWTIPAEARLGTYFVVLSHGDQEVARTSFQVEEFRRPVMDASVKADAHWDGNAQVVDLAAQIAYFAGGPARDLPIQVRHRYLKQVLDPVPGYAFMRLAEEPPAPPPPDVDSPVQALDAQGSARLRVKVPPIERPLLLQTELSFQDPNGETQTSGIKTMLWPDKLVLGLRTRPEERRKPAAVEGMALDAQNRPIADEPVMVRLEPVRSEWRDNRFHIVALGPEIELCSARTDARGEWRCDWPKAALEGGQQPDQWIVSASADALRNSVAPVRTELLVARWNLQSHRVPGLSTLEIDGEGHYKPGDVAVVIARPERLPATLLLTTEREGVMDATVHALTKPEERIGVPLRDEHAPNLRVTARYVYPLYGAAKDAPLAGTEHAEIEVAPVAYRLTVDVRPAKTIARPREQVPVDVSVRGLDGKVVAGARVTLVAVDEALLALKANDSWTLVARMLAARPDLVDTTALDAKLLRQLATGPQPSYMPADEHGRFAGYGLPVASAQAAPATSQPPDAQPARREMKSLILWRADLSSDDAGIAHAVLPLNDAITKFRVFAIATAGPDRFGDGEATVSATQTLQVFSGLPPVLRADDSVVQRLSVRNTGSVALDVTLSAEAGVETSADAIAGRAGVPREALLARGLVMERRLKLAAGATQEVQWRVAVPSGAEALHWHVGARGGDESDGLDVDQRIVPLASVTVRQASLVRVGKATSLPVAQPSGAQPFSGGVRIDLQASLVDAALVGPTRWMERYPYHCLEQQSSRFVTLDDKAAWDRLMLELPKYLDSRGLARYFPESTLGGSEMLTAHLLDLAHAAGWPIPQAQRDQMLDALAGLVQGRLPAQDWAPDGDVLPRQLAAQATLADYGRAALTVRPTALSRLPAQSLIDWARALLAAPASVERQRDIALVSDQLRSRYDVQGTRMRWRDESAQQFWWFMWAGDSIAARAALLAQRLAREDDGWRTDAPLITQGLVGRMIDGHWSTTVGNAWGTLALRRFRSEFDAEPVTGRTRMRLGAASQESSWDAATGAATAGTPSVLLPWPAQGARSTLMLEHEGSGKPWATVSALAAVASTQATANGLVVSRTVTPVEQKHKGKWSVGDVYRVRLDMESTAAQTWVVVRDALPSGATHVGRGLARESSLARAGESSGGWAWPSWVERAADSYRAYFRWVPRGKWHVEYTVRLNNAGALALPPVRVEAMYAPEIFGEGPAQAMRVEP